MKFKQLTGEDYKLIKNTYRDFQNKSVKQPAKKAQKYLASHYGVTTRTIRKWANNLQVNVMKKNIVNPTKIMVYDIETSRVEAKVFWTGKQYINHKQLRGEPKVISISWKWLGEDEVHSLHWDMKTKCDKKMIEEFVKEYNKASMVIGQNNNNFDNKWINARAAKYNLDVNTGIKSFDIYVQAKRKFRIPSYSMAYMCKYFDVEQKLSSGGITTWDKIEEGEDWEREEAMAQMIEYNIGDIISTEALYVRLRKYFDHVTNLGVANGGELWADPDTGSVNVRLYKTSYTAAGTVVRTMINNETGVKYKISNKKYMSYIDFISKQ